MKQKLSIGSELFVVFNYIFLIGTFFICFLPLVHVLAVSLSSSEAAMAGEVKFWPVDFTTKSYEFVINKPDFILSFGVTLKRVLLGVPLNMLLTILIAYPLSKETKDFRCRSFYTWFFLITILFSGGLIPYFMVVKTVGIIDTIWALVLPGAVPVFNVILLLNFFRELPREIEESAFIDGASYLTVLWKMYIPLSKPALATLTLFVLVNHWNAWFDGILFMNSTKNYPLQSFLQNVIVNRDLTLIALTDLNSLSQINERTSRAAQIVLATVPILAVYPFLQKYFVKGIVMGSIKG